MKAETAQERYDALHTVQVKMKLNKDNDADVLDWLAKQDSKQGAIKSLIREKIKEEQ